MLEILKTEDNQTIKAICEYYIVDENGNFDRNGKFVWINEVEVAPQFRNNGCLKSLVRNIMNKISKECEFGYFGRYRKYPNRKFRIYHKSRWLKLIGEGLNVTT